MVSLFSTKEREKVELSSTPKPTHHEVQDEDLLSDYCIQFSEESELYANPYTINTAKLITPFFPIPQSQMSKEAHSSKIEYDDKWIHVLLLRVSHF